MMNRKAPDLPRRIMRLKEVMHICGLGRSSIYSYMKNGKFPKCRPLGGGIVGWDSREVQRWVDAVLDGQEWILGHGASEQHPERLQSGPVAPSLPDGE